MAERDPDYALGHSSRELDRLIEQSRFFGQLTRNVLVEAGLSSGMRVLDVGCGPGDVSFLAASLVGPDGEVVGVDQSPAAIDVARGRAAGVPNVRFVGSRENQADLDHFQMSCPPSGGPSNAAKRSVVLPAGTNGARTRPAGRQIVSPHGTGAPATCKSKPL